MTLPSLSPICDHRPLGSTFVSYHSACITDFWSFTCASSLHHFCSTSTSVLRRPGFSWVAHRCGSTLPSNTFIVIRSHGSIWVSHLPGSSCYAFPMASLSLNSALGLCLGPPVEGSALAPPTIFSALASPTWSLLSSLVLTLHPPPKP